MGARCTSVIKQREDLAVALYSHLDYIQSHVDKKNPAVPIDFHF
jgi:hypothetical protein